MTAGTQVTPLAPSTLAASLHNPSTRQHQQHQHHTTAVSQSVPQLPHLEIGVCRDAVRQGARERQAGHVQLLQAGMLCGVEITASTTMQHNGRSCGGGSSRGRRREVRTHQHDKCPLSTSVSTHTCCGFDTPQHTHPQHTLRQVALQVVHAEHHGLELMLLKQLAGDGASDVGVTHHQPAQVGGSGQHLQEGRSARDMHKQQQRHVSTDCTSFCQVTCPHLSAWCVERYQTSQLNYSRNLTHRQRLPIVGQNRHIPSQPASQPATPNKQSRQSNT